MSPRACQRSMVDTATMAAEAIEFIRAHEPPEGYFVAFSGGKDSIVTLELARMAGVKHAAYYSATGIDPPEVVQFIRRCYPDVHWLRPKMSFYEAVYRKMPPSRLHRWCCDMLKKDPAKAVPLKHRLLGIRAEESPARAARGRIDYHERLKLHQYKSIFGFLEWHIWDFIEGNGLPYPVLYDEGFHRVGCVICPFLCRRNQRMINMHRERWPTYYRAFEHAVKRWWDKKARDRRPENSAEEYITGWYRGFED